MIYVISGKKRTGKDTAASIIEKHTKCLTFALADRLKEILESSCFLEKGYLYQICAKQLLTVGDREIPIPVSNEEVKRMMLRAVETAIPMTRYAGYEFNRSAVSDRVSDLLERHVLNNTEAWSPRRLMQVYGTDIMCSLDEKVWVLYAIQSILESEGTDDVIIKDCRQPHEERMLRQLGAKFIFLNKDTGLVDSHSTEQGLTPKEGDFVIDNNGTLDELETKLLEILK